jgi:prepilin-type N-terminal cleavage/methylation domain-containing protein
MMSKRSVHSDSITLFDRYFTKNASQGGFGLLELMIAMTILAIGILGIMKLQMQASFGNSASRNNSAAVNLARSKLESLKRVGSYSVQEGVVLELQDQNGSTALDNWTNPDFPADPTDPINLINEAEDSSSFGRIFTRMWNVADSTPMTNFKTIRVRVTWSHNGEPRHVDLETQVGLKDLEYFQ